MSLYADRYYPTKKAFKEAIKKNGGVYVYDEGIVPIVDQKRTVKTVRIGGKPHRVIVDSVVGPSKYERKWFATVYLDANDFEHGVLRVIKAK